jgi:hypothetical protein
MAGRGIPNCTSYDRLPQLNESRANCESVDSTEGVGGYVPYLTFKVPFLDNKSCSSAEKDRYDVPFGDCGGVGLSLFEEPQSMPDSLQRSLRRIRVGLTKSAIRTIIESEGTRLGLQVLGLGTRRGDQ